MPTHIHPDLGLPCYYCSLFVTIVIYVKLYIYNIQFYYPVSNCTQIYLYIVIIFIVLHSMSYRFDWIKVYRM